MKRIRITLCLAVVALTLTASASADTFGTGDNQFIIDFVPISGSTNPTSGYGIVNNDYRMGTFEITNDQWQKAGFTGGYWTGDNIPVNQRSWFQAAQFVNWLNIENGHQAAYNFNGSTFTPWTVTDTGYNASNPYRNSKAFYFLPTEDEWVKAAYWNGTNLQTFATKAGESLTQGNGTSGTGWNYYNNGYATNPDGPWNVGSGSEELNGTFDMMGNIYEWIESPINPGDGSVRGLRGGCYYLYDDDLASSGRHCFAPSLEYEYVGFRVASVPEPATLLLLTLGGIALLRRKRKA